MIQFNESKTFFEILKNNVSVAVIAIVIGSFSLGIVGIAIISVNAYLLGTSILFGILKYGPSFLFSILPHGIFEIPGLVMCLVILWEVNSFLFTKLFKKGISTYSLAKFGLSLRKQLVLTIFLILLGALVEGYLTPILIERFI